MSDSTMRRVTRPRSRALSETRTVAAADATAATSSMASEFPSITTREVIAGMSKGVAANSSLRRALRDAGLNCELCHSVGLRSGAERGYRRARQLGITDRALIRPVEHHIRRGHVCNPQCAEMQTIGLRNAEHVRVAWHGFDAHT